MAYNWPWSDFPFKTLFFYTYFTHFRHSGSYLFSKQMYGEFAGPGDKLLDILTVWIPNAKMVDPGQWDSQYMEPDPIPTHPRDEKCERFLLSKSRW